MNKVLETYFCEANLKLAFNRVLCWPDRMVKDRFGINAFAFDLDTNIMILSRTLLEGNYKPQPGFKYFEPKSSGTQRTKTLLMIEDAVVYQAIANVIAQKNYLRLSENNDFVFGSVLTLETGLGIQLLSLEKPNYFFFKFWKSLFGKFKESVIKAIEVDKAVYKLETDITGFFDSIPHYNLLLTLSTEFQIEDEILDLLSVCLNVWSGTKENRTPGVGIPQGPLPSFLLANLLLYPLDKLVINEAHKYYRYMDDIKIYGYSEEDLMDVLVNLDNYLKSHGLSLNSKKTSIQKIDKTKEDETVKEFKRFEILADEYDFTFNSDIQNNIKKSPSEELSKNLSDLLSQTHEDAIFNDDIDIISDRDEIIKYWESEIFFVEKELPNLFKEGELELKEPQLFDDKEFIKYSVKYGTALRELKQFKLIEANPELLKYWLFAIKKYFWRASNYLITLQHYKYNSHLGDELRRLYAFGKNYECFRYHIVVCMTYNLIFDDKQLREIFKQLKEEKSDLVRYSFYCLLIKHTNDQQLLSSVKTQLAKENTEYLKLIVMEYWKKDQNRISSMDDLIKSVGL